MWIEEVEISGSKRHQVLYSYYEKEMSSKYVIHQSTAISRSSKMNILVNELLRVMRNTCLRVNQEEKDKHVQHFINKMQLSGYNQEDRIHVYKKAKKMFSQTTNGKEVYPHVDKLTRLAGTIREKSTTRKPGSKTESTKASSLLIQLLMDHWQRTVKEF